MSATAISGAALAIVIVAVIVIALVVFLIVRAANNRGRRRSALRDQFGPEYQRVVDERGNRSEAERELLDRKQRHDTLQLRPLTAQEHAAFRQEWTAVQAQFVDQPVVSLTSADLLIQRVMAQRGYPITTIEQREADLSVEHAAVLDHYRQANQIMARARDGGASTEDLRQAMVHYRALFSALLEEPSPVQQ